jgi:hypothetical protein
MPSTTLALAALLAVRAFAAEPAIESFETRLTLAEDGSMVVRERVEFGAGFAPVREIPTRRLLWSGLREVSRVELVDAIVDGLPVDLESRSTPRGVLWTTAEALSPEPHVMILRYRTDARVVPREGTDNLIWNVTGFHWEAPILGTTLRLNLPEGVEAVNASIQVGKPGALVDIDRRTERASVYEKIYEEPLAPGEGMRVVARLPKGSIRANAPRTPARALKDNFHVALGAFGAIVLLVFILAARARLRRDPDAALGAPAGPGADLSYASARYLLEGRYRGRTLQAGLTGLLAKRWLSRFEAKDGSWRLERGETPEDALTADERALGESLLNGKREIEFGGTAAFDRALQEHWRVLDAQCAPMVRARAWTLIACALAWSAGIVAAMRTAAVLFEPVPLPVLPSLAAGVLVLAGGAGLVAVWTLTYKAWRAASLPSESGGVRALPLLSAIALGFLSFGLVTAAAQGFQAAIGDLSPAALLAGFALLFLNWAAFYALRGPTADGFDALRRARALVERKEDERFTSAMKATESLAEEVDALI